MHFWGGQRSHWLYEALKSVGEVYLLQYGGEERRIDDHKAQITLRNRAGFRKMVNNLCCRLFHFLLPPLSLVRYPFPYKLDLEKFFPGIKFDLIVTRYLVPVSDFHLWRIAPVYADMDDYVMESFMTMKLIHKNRIHDWFACWLQRFFLRGIEKHVEGGWISNPLQADLVHYHHSAVGLKNIPCFPSSDYHPEEEVRQYLCTIGVLIYPPNYFGIDDFLKNIWPTVHEKFPSLEYHIVGGLAPDEYKCRWEAIPGVKIRGFVKDLSQVYAHAFATVVPIGQGSGTCIKTLESLAYSRICLATRFGARGLSDEEVADGKKGVFCYADAEDFIAILRKIIEHRNWAREREGLASQTALREYSFETFKKTVAETLPMKKSE